VKPNGVNGDARMKRMAATWWTGECCCLACDV